MQSELQTAVCINQFMNSMTFKAAARQAKQRMTATD